MVLYNAEQVFHHGHITLGLCISSRLFRPGINNNVLQAAPDNYSRFSDTHTFQPISKLSNLECQASNLPNYCITWQTHGTLQLFSGAQVSQPAEPLLLILCVL